MFKLLLVSIAVAAVCGLPQRGRFPLQKFGRHIPDGRIEGGHDADIADYPYHLAVIWFGLNVCGASLIGSKWALTSATCTGGTMATEFGVLAGSGDLTGGQLVQVAASYQHPQHEFHVYNYDLAILQLKKDITIENASPIALHDAGYIAEEGADATITGFGEKYLINYTAHALQATVTKVVSNEICKEAYGDDVTETTVCAGNWEAGGESPCWSDWGGPLIVDGKLYGITSWGNGCGQPHYPFVNTRVSAETMREFITKITGL